MIKLKDSSDKLFYIGGVVRDELLNRLSFDVDITYVGNAIDYCKKFGEVIQENPDFGTVRIKVSKEFLEDEKENVIVDFASTRSEIYPKKGHLPVLENIGCSLKDDVLRRDFTINALAKSVKTGEIIDYTGGLKDLEAKKLRVLHDNSFIDDPTRIVRALKFAVRFGFELDEHTKKLQNEYLKNINYDMSYKRLKKELIETFNLNSQTAFEKFINDGIYKLVCEKNIVLPEINIENIVKKYSPENVWLVFLGVLNDLSRLPLTKIEQKILDDVPEHKISDDFELYKAFENSYIESVIIYGILYDIKSAEKYLDKLRNIKLEITGDDLKSLGIPPSEKYREIFDKILRIKLANPNMTKKDEINLVLS